MRLPLVLLSLSTNLVWCIPPPHPAVVAVRREEERLPFHLKSHALYNPHLRQVLPLTSLLHKGEKPVYQREADNVPRREIYKILTHAGFLPRKPGYLQPPNHRCNLQPPNHRFNLQAPNHKFNLQPPNHIFNLQPPNHRFNSRPNHKPYHYQNTMIDEHYFDSSILFNHPELWQYI